MKRILFFSHSASLSGAPLLLFEVANLLNRTGYECIFVIAEPGPLVDRFETIGSTMVEPFFPPGLKYWREVRRFRRRVRLLRMLKPDLLYCNTIHAAKWLFYARLLDIPALSHVHELSMGFDAVGISERFNLRHFSDRFIAVSKSVKEFLVSQQRIPSEKIQVIHAGIRVEQFRKNHNADQLRSELGLDGAIVVGTVGRITHMKGSDLFLELAARLRSTGRPEARIKYLVVGTTEDRAFYSRFQSMIEQHGLRSDIVFLEQITDVAQYYGVMDIFVSTSREDPFPLVVLEAMASGKPVVAFGTGGIPEAVTPECGVLIDKLDVVAMVASIDRLIGDPGGRASMGKAGRTRVEEFFDISKNIRAIKSIVDVTVRGAG